LLKSVFRRIFGGKGDSAGQRIVIIHNHLFKNAGSTIDWSLRRNFGRQFVDHRDDQQMLRGASYLGPYLSGKKNLKALSTHHLVLPLPELEGTRLMMIFMMRHPIERVQSVYNFERKQKHAKTPGAVHARKMDLEEYIEWRMRPDVGETIRNFHTIRCLGAQERVRTDRINEEIFAQAEKTLRSIEMIGLVERFDESMVLFEENLRPFFPEIDLSYRIQNVGQSGKTSRAERIDSLRLNLGETVNDLLVKNNSWDLKLYDIACEEFSARLEEVEDLVRKKADFDDRCRRLQA